jgi:hypothetical protein
VTRNQFREQIRNHVREVLERDGEEYLGTAQVRDVSLVDPDGNLSVVFTDASRPGRLNVWTWAFPNVPPAGHAADANDISGYAGWLVGCLREALMTGNGIASAPEQK